MMARLMEENAPECVDHFCARCLEPLAEDAQECPSCSRRFDGRGRFYRPSGASPGHEPVGLVAETQKQASGLRSRRS